MKAKQEPAPKDDEVEEGSGYDDESEEDDEASDEDEAKDMQTKTIEK